MRRPDEEEFASPCIVDSNGYRVHQGYEDLQDVRVLHLDEHGRGAARTQAALLAVCERLQLRAGTMRRHRGGWRVYVTPLRPEGT
jgi:hypothetical protein